MPPLISRELSWLDFNARVLSEAQRKDNLPLERLHFLSITASNLDEFVMVRVAYLYDQSKTLNKPDAAGMTPHDQLTKVLSRMQDFAQEQDECLMDIRETLAQEGIRFVTTADLLPEQLSYAQELFDSEVLPVITPLAVDPSRPFPFLLNKSLNIGVRLHDAQGEDVYAVIQVPAILPRFLAIPSAQERLLLPMESLIAHNLPFIFNLHRIRAYGLFRITRSADFDADEDTDDLLEEMKRTIWKRKRGKPIRLELSADFDEKLRAFLESMLGIKKRFVMEMPGLIDLSALSRVASMDGYERLRRRPILPVDAGDFEGQDDIFAAIRDRDRMVHHPYQTFDHVLDFIQKAAADENVLAIKQTLYRVSGRSQVIAALERAAENSKQVTVLVELKARFDEENNIQWAKRLERAGCHVIYGLAGLKTHCKITLVIRREPEGIRRYVHMSTGNYNDVTARVYTDIGMFSCRPAFGVDASALFNHLTGFSKPMQYHKLIVAPEGMKTWFLQKIELEIQNARRGLPCGIFIKVNSLLDEPVILKLYEASQAGVPIDLLVRGICALLPGVPGVSEGIRVRSIVGRFLEHSRIFMFENGGDPLVYMGSADLMPRNLDRRVELVFPVEEPILRERLRVCTRLQWSDNTNAWELGADGVYNRVPREGETVNSQEEMIRLAKAELIIE